MIEAIKNHYTNNEKLILLTCASIFMPYYISVMVLLIDLIYLIYTKQLMPVVQSTAGYKSLILFAVFTAFNSYFHHNKYGVGITALIVLLVVFFMFFRQNVTKVLMRDCMMVVLLMSGICFGMTVLGYGNVWMEVNGNLTDFMVELKDMRATSVFSNTNYYAMICEFIILISVFYGMNAESANAKKLSYSLSALGFVTLFCIENRTALPTLAIALLILTSTMEKKKMGIMILIAYTGMTLFINFGELIFPRYGILEDALANRMSIWRGALMGIKENFWLGQGGMSYLHLYDYYGTFPGKHAHNIFLDSLLNYGVIGLAMLIPFVKQLYLDTMALKGTQVFRLVIAMSFVVGFHGLFDATIFWHQTAFVYFLILMGAKQLNTKEMELIPDHRWVDLRNLKPDYLNFNLFRRQSM